MWKKVLATVFTISLSLQSFTVLADESETQVALNQDLEAQIDYLISDLNLKTEESSKITTTSTETTLETEVDEEIPGLLPGDFFYFVKVLTEKIKIALSFDDYKKAQLLADYAHERIKEANALIAAGETELAGEVLQKAVDQQELAINFSKQNETEITEENTEENTETAEENTEEQSLLVQSNLEAKFVNNIETLLSVAAKLENPQAQQALAKNIEKSFQRLGKKLEKTQLKEEKTQEKLEEVKHKLNEELTKIKLHLNTGVITDDEALQELKSLFRTAGEKSHELTEKLEGKLSEMETKLLNKQQKLVEKALEKQEIIPEKLNNEKGKAAHKAEKGAKQSKKPEHAGHAGEKQQKTNKE